MNVQLEPEHLAIVREVLRPAGVPVYVFGSRAKNTAKKFSDLDLVIKGKIDPGLLRSLRSSFEESNLPFKVDLVLWSDLDESFKKHIENDLVAFE